jgi:hypothetical protein
MGSSKRSNILIDGQRRETGLYALEGFNKGMIIELFQMSGIQQPVTDRLNSVVKY